MSEDNLVALGMGARGQGRLTDSSGFQTPMKTVFETAECEEVKRKGSSPSTPPTILCSPNPKP